MAAFGLLLFQGGRAPSRRQMSSRDWLFAGIAIGFALVFSLIAGEVVLGLFVGAEILLKPEKAAEFRWRVRRTGSERGTQEGPYDYDRFDPRARSREFLAQGWKQWCALHANSAGSCSVVWGSIRVRS